MPEDTLPKVLIVDDEETGPHELGLDGLAATRGRHPNDIDDSDLQWADLVLMDFRIQTWPEREDLEQISLRPRNGLALAAVLREHADALNGKYHRYTAFAIHSAHIGDISARLHTTNRTPCVVARLNSLEWAFDKAEQGRFSQAAELAQAVRKVSEGWKDVEASGVAAATSGLLRLPAGLDWSERASEDVLLCQIPLSDFSAGTNGLLFLRWLLHGIMPYPTFLLGSNWVAARLRITPDSLRDLLENKSQLARDLSDCRYAGILQSFSGPRWWRSAIEQYAWSIRAGGAHQPEDFHSALEARAGRMLERVAANSPVVCVDPRLEPLDGLQALDSVVRLVPDLWPAYADPAYAELAVVRNDEDLCSIVHPLDRERVTAAEEED